MRLLLGRSREDGGQKEAAVWSRVLSALFVGSQGFEGRACVRYVQVYRSYVIDMILDYSGEGLFTQ